MSNMGQSIIDTPMEDQLDSMPTLEPDWTPTPEEEAEAMEAHAIWEATVTMKSYLWEVNIVVNAVRYSGLMTSKEEPDHRTAAAVIATVYNMGMDGAAQLINAINTGKASVVSHQPTIHDTDTIKSNYIPF